MARSNLSVNSRIIAYAVACGVVERQWDETATAKAQREAAKKTEDDLVWLRAWVQTLRAGKP